jgi:DNA-binding MarR family transcriptional regulator
MIYLMCQQNTPINLTCQLICYGWYMQTALANDLQVKAWIAFHQLRVSLLPPLIKNLTQKCGVSEAEYQVLIGIYSSPEDGIRPTDLAEKIGWENGRLSHQLSRMESKGLVDRRECPVDARSCYIALSKNGRVKIDKTIPVHLKEVKRLFGEALSPDQLKALIEIADAVSKHMEEINPPIK